MALAGAAAVYFLSQRKAQAVPATLSIVGTEYQNLPINPTGSAFGTPSVDIGRMTIPLESISNIRELNPAAGAYIPNLYGNLATQYQGLSDAFIRTLPNIPVGFSRDEQYSAPTWELINKEIARSLGY